MKRSIALLFLLAAMVGGASDVYQPIAANPPAPAREFRGAWIATVANRDWPSAPGLSVAQQQAELIALFNTAVNLGLNAVVFQVRPAGDAMYPSDTEPWSEYLTGVQGQPPQPYYDPLEFAINEAHRRGLELHAWFNPFRVRLPAGGNLAENSIARTHPEWVRNFGGQLWLDPGEPAAREYILHVIIDVVRRYDVDGVQFDDYFYPYPIDIGKGIFVPFPDGTSWRQYGEGSSLSRDDWRRQNINQFIQSVYQSIKSAKPWVKFGVSPFGIWRPGNPPQIRGMDAYSVLFADSRRWLANGWVDYFSPQLYWPINSPGQSFPVLLNWWDEQNTRRRNLWPGLDASSAGIKFPIDEIAQQIQITRAQPGASGEILFHLSSLEQNVALANSIASEYSYPALVPASPWLDSLPPAKPEITPRQTPPGWTFQWTVPANTHVAKWLLQYYDTDYTWKTCYLPANQTEQKFNFSPQMVSIRALDRAGTLSPVAAVGRAGAASGVSATGTSAPASGATTSFWKSYKER